MLVRRVRLQNARVWIEPFAAAGGCPFPHVPGAVEIFGMSSPRHVARSTRSLRPPTRGALARMPSWEGATRRPAALSPRAPARRGHADRALEGRRRYDLLPDAEAPSRAHGPPAASMRRTAYARVASTRGRGAAAAIARARVDATGLQLRHGGRAAGRTLPPRAGAVSAQRTRVHSGSPGRRLSPLPAFGRQGAANRRESRRRALRPNRRCSATCVRDARARPRAIG